MGKAKTRTRARIAPKALAGVQPKRKRERLFVIRLNDLEREMIDAVAEHHGMNATQILRQLIRREHDRIRSALR